MVPVGLLQQLNDSGMQTGPQGRSPVGQDSNVCQPSGVPWAMVMGSAAKAPWATTQAIRTRSIVKTVVRGSICAEYLMGLSSCWTA